MTRRQTNHGPSFDDQLVLFRYFLHELKLDSLSALSEKLNSSEYEGVNESGNTYFYIYIARVCQMRGATITPENCACMMRTFAVIPERLEKSVVACNGNIISTSLCLRKCIWIATFPTRMPSATT